MKLLTEFTHGSLYQQQSFTAHDALRIIQNDARGDTASSFRILDKCVNIDVKNKGETFSVSVFEPSNTSYSVMVSTYKKIGSIEKLAELIADYSPEKLETFEEDTDYGLRYFLDKMTPEFKDELLYNMIKKERKI